MFWVFLVHHMGETQNALAPLFYNMIPTIEWLMMIGQILVMELWLISLYAPPLGKVYG